MQRTSRTAAAVALALLLPGGLAACGDDDDTSAGDQVTESSAEGGNGDEPTGDPIKIMNISEYSRTPAPVPEIADGVEAAAAAINAAGGIDGRPIEVLTCDTELDPNVAAACGREAVEEDVVAVVGHYGLSGDSFLPILASAGIPVIGGAPVSGDDLTSEVFFPHGVGAPVILTALPGALGAAGVESFSFSYLDFAGGQAFVEFVSKGAEIQDVEMANTLAIPGSTPDMTPFLSSALSDDVGGLAVTLGASDFVKFVRAARTADPDAVIGVHSTSATAPSTLETLGDDGDGIVTPLPCKPTNSDDPDVQRWRDELAAHDEDAILSSASQYGWESVYLFAEVATGLDELTSESVFGAMPSVSFEGMLCAETVNFDSAIDEFDGVTRIFSTHVIYAEASGGEWQATTGEFVDAFEATD